MLRDIRSRADKAMLNITPSQKKQFWDRVDIVRDLDSCWNWKGCTRKGYGLLTVGLKSEGTKSTVLAHRLANYLVRDEIDSTRDVSHTCDNPKCCRPSHLSLVSHADNLKQMGDRGRAKGGLSHKRHKEIHGIGRNAGEVNGRGVLSWDEVNRIRELYSEGGTTQQELADKFHISQCNVCDIVNHKTWRIV